MVYAGRFEHKIDSKHRMYIPACYRSNFRVFYAYLKSSGSVTLYDEDFFNRMIEDLDTKASESENPDEELDKLAFFVENCYRCECDDTGRFTMPADFAIRAGLSAKVLVVGSGLTLNVWNPDAYAEYRAKNNSSNSIPAGVR